MWLIIQIMPLTIITMPPIKPTRAQMKIRYQNHSGPRLGDIMSYFLVSEVESGMKTLTPVAES